MCFIDADGSYVFTLGIDACEPQEHRIDNPLILRVGNQDVSFLETVNCTRSNGMYFHEHRLRPLGTSDLDLVTRAVQQYCNKLQTLQENPAINEGEQVVVLPSQSDSSVALSSPADMAPTTPTGSLATPGSESSVDTTPSTPIETSASLIFDPPSSLNTTPPTPRGRYFK